MSDPVVSRLNTAMLDRYHIERELGVGGMATVYLAEDLKHHRKVAVKVLKPELASALGAERFLREIEIAANLTHPHILPVHDSGEADGLLYFVMPYVKGESLRERLDRERQLPLDDAIRIAREVAGALDLAHRQGVIHRDIKPANILFEEGHAVVADFGIAKAVAATGQERLTQTGLSVGTPQYMSPEQATGEPTDARSDIYSLGAVLYEMLTGEPPYTGPTTHAIVAKLITERPIRPGVLRETVPERVDQAVMKTLARSPADRFATAGELADALAGVAEVDPATRPRRRPTQWAIGAGLTLAAAGIGWWVTGRDGSRPPVEDPMATPRTTPFLTTNAIEKQPAWNPAGNLIAYVSDESGNEDIWISDQAGTNQLNITEAHPGMDAHPTWSPDGQHLAFYSIRDGAGIYTMTSLGGAVRKVTTVTAGVLYTFSLQWAPDGRLVYTDFDEAGTKQVYSVSAVGSDRECLTCDLPNVGSQSGQLSPNGELLAFKSSQTGPRGNLYVTQLSSGQVAEVGSGVARPQWDAEGERLFFISDLDGLPDLWVISIDPRRGEARSVPHRLTSGLDVADYSVRGDTTVLAVKRRTAATLWEFPADRPRVALADGEQLTTTRDFLDARPRWAEALGGLVFESTRRGSLDVWLLPLATRELRRLTTSPATEFRPRPSPPGQWISFEVEEEGGSYIHLMRPDGSGRHMTGPPTAIGWCSRRRDQGARTCSPLLRSIPPPAFHDKLVSSTCPEVERNTRGGRGTAASSRMKRSWMAAGTCG